MTATSKTKGSEEKVNPVLPKLDDPWLLSGVAFYFTRIEERQLKVAGDIYDLLSRFADKDFGSRASFLKKVRDDYETLNDFFQKTVFEHPRSDGWVPASLHGSSNEDNRLSAEEEDELDVELQASFKLEDDDDQEPLSQRQIEHLESHASLAASTLNPPKLQHSQCRRFSDSDIYSSDGPACELPARPGPPTHPVNNNETNNDLISEIGTLSASKSTSLLLTSTSTVAQRITSSGFVQESSFSFLRVHSSRPTMGNVDSPPARVSTKSFVTQQRNPSFATPALSSALRQSPAARIFPTSPTYPRPTLTRVRTGGMSTMANRMSPKSTKKAHLLGGLL